MKNIFNRELYLYIFKQVSKERNKRSRQKEKVALKKYGEHDQRYKVMRRHNGEAVTKVDQISYSFVPSEDFFIKDLIDLINSFKISTHDKIKIIDLGCGMSPVLIYLKHIKRNENNLYIQVSGIDNERYWINKMKDCQIDARYGDLTNLSKDNLKLISEQDIVYLYTPIANREIYMEVIKKVWSHMKKGAYLVDFYSMAYIHDVLEVEYTLVQSTTNSEVKTCVGFKK